MFYKEAKIKERTADYLLVITGEHNQKYAEDTSKFYEYLSTRCPIIVIGRRAEIYKKFNKVNRIFWMSINFSEEEIKEAIYFLN